MINKKNKMKKTIKLLMYLAVLPLVSCGQNKKENTKTTTQQAQTNKQFIETLVCEPVYEYKGKEKQIVFPNDAGQYGTSSPFLELDQTPKYDEMSNLVNGVSYQDIREKKILFTGVEDNKYWFTIDGKKYKIIVPNKTQIGNKEFYNLFDANYIEKIKKGLEGKILYTQTSEWIYKPQKKEEDYGVNSEYEIENEKSCQYCPVTITKVVKEQSNDYAVYFKHQNNSQEYKFDIVLDKDRSFGIPIDLMEEFTKYLSFESPNKGKDISEKNWENIQNLKIEKGMTKAEIEIMLGKPDETVKGNIQKPNQEIWFYSNINRKAYSILFTKDKVVEYIEGKY